MWPGAGSRSRNFIYLVQLRLWPKVSALCGSRSGSTTLVVLCNASHASSHQPFKELWNYGVYLYDLVTGVNVVQVEECEVEEVCVDRDNRLVTTPAFMYDATFCQVGTSRDLTPGPAFLLTPSRVGIKPGLLHVCVDTCCVELWRWLPHTSLRCCWSTHFYMDPDPTFHFNTPPDQTV